MKTFLISLGAAIALCAVAVVLFVMLASGRQLKPIAEWGAERILQKDVAIGTLEIARGKVVRIEMTDIKIANAEWIADTSLADIGLLTVAFHPLSVFKSVLDIELLQIEEAVLRPTLDEEGQSNWSTGGGDDTPSDSKDATVPGLRKLVLRDVRAEYGILGADGIEILHEVRIEDGSGTSTANDPAMFEADGIYREQALSVVAKGDTLAALMSRSAPYEFEVTVAGAVDAVLSGALGLDNTVEDLSLELAGETLAVLSPFLPAPIPDTPPFSIAGKLDLGDGVYSFSNFKGTVGDSDIAGDTQVDLTGERPKITGSITSELLDFDDLAGLIGAEPDPDETANPQQKEDAGDQPLIPNTPLPVAELRRADVDLSLVATKVSSPIAQVERVDARVVLQDGRLVINPLNLGVSGGEVTGEVAVNVRDEVPSADIDLALTGVSFAKFFENSEFAQEMGGAISGKVYFLGVGSSLADMVATARGNGHLILREGKVSALIVEGAGVDIAEALGVLIAGDSSVPMECAVGAVSAADGVVTIKQGAASTVDSTVIAGGSVNLKSQTISMQVETRAKDFSLLDLDVPVYIEGSFAKPSVSLGGLDPLPFFQFGENEGVGCDLLIDAARQSAPGIAP